MANSRLSLASTDSFLSIASQGSVLSIGSIGSAASAGAVMGTPTGRWRLIAAVVGLAALATVVAANGRRT